MCFALFLGASVPPPIIGPAGHKFGDGQIHTQALREYNAPVKQHFTLPHVVYVGSDQGCGCGFRSVSFQGFWPDEGFEPDADSVPGNQQGNHLSLVSYLSQHLGQESFVEFYGCWEGDFALPEKDRREIVLEEIARPQFHFRHQGFCRVKMGN